MTAGAVIAIAGAAALALATGRPFAEVAALEGQVELSMAELLAGGRQTALWIVVAAAPLAAIGGLVRPDPRLPAGAVIASLGVIACAIVLPQLINPLFLYEELAVNPTRRWAAVLAGAGAVAVLAGGLLAWMPAALRAPAPGEATARAPFGRVLAAFGGLALLGSLFLRWGAELSPPGWDQGTTVGTAILVAAVLASLAHLLWSMAGGEELEADAMVGLLGAAAAIAVSQLILQAPGGFGGASAGEWLALGSGAAVAAGGYVEWRRPA